MPGTFTLKVDWSVLKTEAANVQKEINNIDQVQNQIKTAKASIYNIAYIGNSANVFATQLDGFLKRFQALHELLTQYITVLNSAATTYETTETNLTNQAQTLPC